MADAAALLEELERERALRIAAEEDRARLQRARDELAKECLQLQLRSAEVEELLAAAKAELDHFTASPSPAKNARSLQRDVKILLRELDQEREVNTAMAEELAAAKADAAEAIERMLVAEKHVKVLRNTRSKDSSKQDAKNTKDSKSKQDSTSTVEAASEDLRAKMIALKTARDRLIAEMDAQATEVARLADENAVLATTTLEVRGEAERWEAQAQAGMAQCSRLKDLLTEGASWGDDTGLENRGQNAGGNEGDSAESRCQKLEQKVLAAAAKQAELESQVAALCGELARCSSASAGLHRAVLPLLGGIEARLGVAVEKVVAAG